MAKSYHSRVVLDSKYITARRKIARLLGRNHLFNLTVLKDLKWIIFIFINDSMIKKNKNLRISELTIINISDHIACNETKQKYWDNGQ